MTEKKPPTNLPRGIERGSCDRCGEPTLRKRHTSKETCIGMLKARVKLQAQQLHSRNRAIEQALSSLRAIL